MLRHERHLTIIEQLKKKETLSLEDLMRVIHTSESTLRRDIDYLSDMKQVQKVRGGITRIARISEASRLTTSPFLSEQMKNADHKAAIGQAAADLLSGDESIIINGGTTTWHMAEHLPKSGLTILTNSLPVIDYIAKQTSNRCFTIGGEVFHHHMIILGHLRSERPNFFGKIFFSGCQGISPWGIMEGDPLLVHAEQEFLSQSEKLVILADSSKFTTRKSMIMCPLNDVFTVISDDHIDDGSRKMLEEAGVNLIISGKKPIRA